MNSPICPTCNSVNTCPIRYGYPSAEAIEEAKEKRIVLGGCEICADNPSWYCNDCGLKWGKIEVFKDNVKKNRKWHNRFKTLSSFLKITQN